MTFTLEQFLELQPEAIIAQDELTDGDKGVLIHKPGTPLKFVAVKGHVNDWACYVHRAEHSYDYIRRHGDKCYPRSAQILIDCDDEVKERYRL